MPLHADAQAGECRRLEAPAGDVARIADPVSARALSAASWSTVPMSRLALMHRIAALSVAIRSRSASISFFSFSPPLRVVNGGPSRRPGRRARVRRFGGAGTGVRRTFFVIFHSGHESSTELDD